MTGPERLSRTLESLLLSAGLPEVGLRVALARAWERIVGPLLSGRTRPSRVRGGVLSVLVQNHSWAQELQLAKPALLEAIARVLGEGKVRDLRFVVGPIPAEEADPPFAGEEGGAPAPPLQPDPGGIEDVRDPETREILRSICRKSSRRKR